MGKLSDADARNVLDSRFGAGANGPSNAPGTYYIGLSTTQPTDAGANVTEPSGNAYARVAYLNNTANWPAATNRSKSNGTIVTFPTATGNWGTVGYFVLMDAASGGTMRAWGQLTTAQSIATGATPTFPVGALVVSAPGT